MLSYLLVWIVSLGSVGFYLSGFLLPEVARKYDLIWGGLGLIYALDLLADHSRIKGGLLLGQMASVALIVWFGWQTVQQRRQLTPEAERTPLPNSIDGALPFLKQGWARLLAAYGQEMPERSGNLVAEAMDDFPRSAAATVLVEEDLEEDEALESEASTAIAPEEPAVATLHPDSPEPEPEPLAAETNAEAPETERDAQDNIAEEASPILSDPSEEPTTATPEVAVTIAETSGETNESETLKEIKDAASNMTVTAPSPSEPVEPAMVSPAMPSEASDMSDTDSISEEPPTEDHHASQANEGEDWPPREIDT